MTWLNTIMAVCIITVSMNAAAASGENISRLKNLISSFDDLDMDSQDFAFFLAAHNYDAIPSGGHVVVMLEGAV